VTSVGNAETVTSCAYLSNSSWTAGAQLAGSARRQPRTRMNASATCSRQFMVRDRQFVPLWPMITKRNGRSAAPPRRAGVRDDGLAQRKHSAAADDSGPTRTVQGRSAQFGCMYSAPSSSGRQQLTSRIRKVHWRCSGASSPASVARKAVEDHQRRRMPFG